jgi:thiamine biosynthesis lipoprotein
MTVQPSAGVSVEGALVASSWRALGTYVRLVVVEGAALEAADALLRTELDAVDRACSRFREDSDLSLVNRNAGRPVPVGSYLIGALDAALRVAAMTGGLVDPLLGTAVIAAGYDRDFAALPADGPAARTVRPRPQEWRRIQVDRWLGTVRIPVGTRLDLGSSGKAHAAQRAAHAIARTTGSGVLVSLGGDIAVAGRPPEDGWTVRIAERPEEDGSGSVVVIRDGGLATSSSMLRRWRRAGVDQHHIIDPRTGRPAADHWRTATVSAASCVDANAASTAAIVMGRGAAEWLGGLGLPSRLVDRDGRVSPVGGWPDEPVVLR